MTIDRILELAQHNNASDIHISPGNPVMLRIDGKLVPQTNDLLRPDEVLEIMTPLLTPLQLEDLKEYGEIDFAFSFSQRAISFSLLSCAFDIA